MEFMKVSGVKSAEVMDLNGSKHAVQTSGYKIPNHEELRPAEALSGNLELRTDYQETFQMNLSPVLKRHKSIKDP